MTSPSLLTQLRFLKTRLHLVPAPDRRALNEAFQRSRTVEAELRLELQSEGLEDYPTQDDAVADGLAERLTADEQTIIVRAYDDVRAHVRAAAAAKSAGDAAESD